MGQLSAVILFLTIAFLAYQYPTMLKSFLPAWLAPAQTSADSAESTTGSSKHDTEDEASEGDSTPKAKPELDSDNVPTFTLSENVQEDEDTEDSPVTPSFPAVNSAQRASSTLPPPPPPPKPSSNRGPGLMPPPMRPTSTPKPSGTASLRIPSTGPLPNRGPPAGSQQRISSSLAPNGTAKSTPNPRNKVLLQPGHSPMDWAALTKRGNISGVSTFQRVTPSQLKTMTGRKGKPAWSSWQGKVYNITPYLPFHPGGEAELMKAAGRDGTKLFMDVHPWVNWENMLETCLVGMLVPESYGQGDGSLEDMD